MATRTVAINTSAPREGLVKMPSYTIQEDPPWVPRSHISAAPSSIYSTGSDVAMADGEVSPSSMKQASYHAHPQQEITDPGPQYKRHSRLPIFKQVRTMLTKPGSTTKWDELSGEPSETGRPAQVKPSTYVSPWEGAFQAHRRSPDRKTPRSKKSVSPVSVLRDDERSAGSWRSTSGTSPRSISPVSTLHSLAPSQISVNSVATPPPALNARKQVTRKPVNVSLSPSASENFPPSPLRSADSRESIGKEQNSRFSWSTVAPSLAGKTESTDNTAMRTVKGTSSSRFSWSTVATNTTYTHHEEAEPPSPPPTIPAKYLQPPQTITTAPTQSVLSRKRPVQPRDRESSPSTPSVRAFSSASPSTSRATTPTTRTSSLKAPTITTTPDSTGTKALPLPPFMTSAQASHLEHLLEQEKNLLLQRRNIEKAIADLEKVQKASPMQVSFATVRDAKRRLDEQKGVLSEVKREEMELGIKIARVRRKEDFGEGEGTLWVRRVTG